MIREALILFVFLSSALFSSAESQKPNVIFLLVDDLGWGDFGAYGAKFYETPNIDKLAADGMLFTNAYAACTVCSPSRAAILSGCYPARLHLTDWITGHNQPKAKLKIPDWRMKIDHDRILLPEALKEAGYATGFFGKWHLMPNGQPDMQEHLPTNHGFDINIGGREWGQPMGKGKYFYPFDMPGLDEGKPGDYLTDKLTDKAIEFMDQNDKEKPFFLYFSYYTLHRPWMAPADRLEKFKKKAATFQNKKRELLNPIRAAMVESLDLSIGRLVEKLEMMRITDNTIIFLTGDNGGSHPATSGGLRNCKGYSHEGAVREPLIVKWPKKIKAGTITHEMVIGMDFYPTILDFVGLDAKPNQHADGVSFAPLLCGAKKDLDRDTLYWHYPHYHHTTPYGAIRKGDWKLIEFFEDGKLELFDLKNDPHESKDLSEVNVEKSQQLLERLKAWRISVKAQKMTPNPNYEPSHVDKKKVK